MTRAHSWPTDTRRGYNRKRILRALRDGAASNRGELTQVTGLARTTVTSIVAELLRDGAVIERSAESAVRRTGRPAAVLALAPSTNLVVGIDFGHGHCAVGIADSGATLITEMSTEIETGASADRALAHAAECVQRLLADIGPRSADVVQAVIGIPAPVDLRTGAVGSSNILPGWVDRRPAADLQAMLGLPVLLDNDANLGALAEVTYGAAQGLSDVIYVKVSTGIGAGLILGGKVFRGSAGLAGEIGHVPIAVDGAVCRCGNRGCLETVVSVRHVFALLQHAHDEPVDMDKLVALIGARDPGAARVLDDTGRTIGRVLADMCNTLNPDGLVLGGELARVGEPLLVGVRTSLERYAQPGIVRSLKVMTGSLGDRAQLLGAIARAHQAASAGTAAAS